MPPTVVPSPLGLPLGDRGRSPLLDAFADVGDGVLAGGPYTLPMLGGHLLLGTGVSNRTGAHRGRAQISPVSLHLSKQSSHPSCTRRRARKASGAWDHYATGATRHTLGGRGYPFPFWEGFARHRDNPQVWEGPAQHREPTTHKCRFARGGVGGPTGPSNHSLLPCGSP